MGQVTLPASGPVYMDASTPDAIHMATALEAGCTLFVTSDPAFGRVPGLVVAVLSEIAAA